jgi:malate synthase
MALNVLTSAPEGAGKVLSREALAFVESLHRQLNGRREELLAARAERQKFFDRGEVPGLLESTKSIRGGEWKVAPTPKDLQKRHVEITGPVERKMMINALNSGADVFMADFEDSLSPSWRNVVVGQQNCIDAVVALQYINSWLLENGAAAIYNLMEDAATAEISRAQLWQWIRHGAKLEDGRPATRALYQATRDEQLKRLTATEPGRYKDAATLLDSMVLTDQFPEFLTLLGYAQLD